MDLVELTGAQGYARYSEGITTNINTVQSGTQHFREILVLVSLERAGF